MMNSRYVENVYTVYIYIYIDQPRDAIVTEMAVSGKFWGKLHFLNAFGTFIKSVT